MIKDLEIREQATRDFSKSWSVEASAGTGKTTLLATRYANLLEESGGQISSIVAITFTEKAAHELKERIESILKERNPTHASIPLLKNAYISTIHAFCMRILKEKSLEAGIDPEFKMIDPLTAYSFLKQCFMDWLAALSEKDWQSLLRCVSMGLSLDQIKQTALDLYRYRDMQEKINLEPSAGVDFAKVSSKFKEICERLKGLRLKAESSCIDPADAGYLQIIKLYELAEQAERLLDTPEEWERFFIHRFRIPAGKGTQKGWKPATDLALQKAALLEMSLELEALKIDLRRASFFKLLHTLKNFTAYVEVKKAEKSYVDFDDLLFKTKTLLATQPLVLAALRHKFDFFLIDEYQDTDPLQAEIIWRLCSEGYEESWLHNPLVPSKLFLVGDPKQSIYRFRRASIEIYEATTQRVVEQGGRLVIDQNFRSSAPVIAAVNHMFRAIFNESYSDISSLPSHLFSASPAVHILKVTDAPLKLGADDQRKLEANMIAAFIQDTLRKNEPIVFDRKTERLRPAKQGDFAILFPTTTGMDFYEEAFRHHDLSFSVEGGSAFFHRLEIHGAIRVLNAIIAPRDSISVVAALKSVIFGLSDQQIYELSKILPTFDYRQASSVADPVVKEALTILKQLHALHTQRPSTLLTKLYEQAWTLPISMQRFHGAQASANLLKLVSIARHLEQQGLQSLRDFLDWVEETAEQKSQETEAFLSEKDDEHINFMTIHRSKGLEFPIVILANASGQSRAHGESILCDRSQGWIEVGIGPESERFSTLHYEEKLAHEKKCHEDEQKRLLYVAMTRARDKIILPRFSGDEKKPSLLWSYLEKSLAGMEPPPLEISSSALEGVEKKDPEVTPPPKNHEFEMLQKIYEQISPAGVPAAQPPAQALQISHGRNMGTLFHHALEKIDLKAKNHSIILQKICEEKGLLFLKPSVEALIERFYRMPIYARLCAAEAIYREVPWSYADQGRLFDGTMDCIFKDAEGYHILDYKTDQTLDESSQIYADYKDQIKFYAHAFERMFNLKPASLVLVFVSAGQEKTIV